MCLRLSSREISSIPCVRPSIVWNGMNESGTNSVKPPVRSWSSRTTRMCSASSQGSSMWPNITVTVVRTPAAWAASMISTQRATGSLFGRDALAHAVVQHLGGRAGGGAEPGGRQAREDLRERKLAGHEVQLHGRVGVQVHIRPRASSFATRSQPS